MDLATVFERYVDIHNKREWERLPDCFAPHVINNGQAMSLDDFGKLQAEEVDLMPGLSMTMQDSIQVKGATEVGAAIRSTGTLSRACWGVEPTATPFHFWRHFLCRFLDGKISEIYVVTNVDEIRAGQRGVDSLPELSTRPAEPPVDLASVYRAYIACINARTMEHGLSQFCHPVVTWNGMDLPLDKYRMLMEDSFDAIPDMLFNVTVLAVDDAQQVLAVRIEFQGTPVKEYAGAAATGRSVSFAEHALYWLDQGKIRRVHTAIDLETYRAQLRG